MLIIKVLEVSLTQKWSFKQNCINSVILMIKRYLCLSQYIKPQSLPLVKETWKVYQVSSKETRWLFANSYESVPPSRYGHADSMGFLIKFEKKKK